MIKAYTSDPAALLQLLKDLVQEGKIGAWAIDKENSFWHIYGQVSGKCYFDTSEEGDHLQFIFKWAKGIVPDIEWKAELHAHAVRMLMIYDGSMASSIEVTMPR